MAKILITDDAQFMRDMLLEMLESMGHEVVSATNGAEMLEMYEAEKPDVVFLDLIMPGQPGMKIMESLLEKHPDAKIVICSAISSLESVVRDAFAKGAVCLVQKPFGVKDLAAAIEKCM